MRNVASSAIKLIALGMLGFAGNRAFAQSMEAQPVARMQIVQTLCR